MSNKLIDNDMKKRYLFTMLAAVAVLLSCSKANVPLEDETLFESQTRNESVQNKSIVESGISGTVEPWIENILDTLYATELPKDEIGGDTISNDSIPIDNIPKNRLTLKY